MEWYIPAYKTKLPELLWTALQAKTKRPYFYDEQAAMMWIETQITQNDRHDIIGFYKVEVTDTSFVDKSKKTVWSAQGISSDNILSLVYVTREKEGMVRDKEVPNPHLQEKGNSHAISSMQ